MDWEQGCAGKGDLWPRNRLVYFLEDLVMARYLFGPVQADYADKRLAPFRDSGDLTIRETGVHMFCLQCARRPL